MSQISFSSDWLWQFSDPYAVLGISISADDRRVLKRYRSIAKLLHPDSYATDPSMKDLASQIFARLVNPSYHKLKHDSGRAENVASLRYRVRQILREDPSFTPSSGVAQQLLRTPLQSVDIIYEEAIARLAELQFQQLAQFALITEQISELHLVYLRLKMGEPIMREKRTGIVPIDKAQPIEISPVAIAKDKVDTSRYYAERHYQRAQEYVKKSNWSLAVQELRDAIRIDANKSDYHALLAKAYLMQNLPGMATVHFRQALKLNPKDPLAVEYAQKLKISMDAPKSNKSDNAGGLFGLFAKKR
jgi:tetratricopeptide (TPR) repeat protein